MESDANWGRNTPARRSTRTGPCARPTRRIGMGYPGARPVSKALSAANARVAVLKAREDAARRREDAFIETFARWLYNAARLASRRRRSTNRCRRTTAADQSWQPCVAA